MGLFCRLNLRSMSVLMDGNSIAPFDENAYHIKAMAAVVRNHCVFIEVYKGGRCVYVPVFFWKCAKVISVNRNVESG